jgi:hypothetical protein
MERMGKVEETDGNHSHATCTSGPEGVHNRVCDVRTTSGLSIQKALMTAALRGHHLFVSKQG